MGVDVLHAVDERLLLGARDDPPPDVQAVVGDRVRREQPLDVAGDEHHASRTIATTTRAPCRPRRWRRVAPADRRCDDDHGEALDVEAEDRAPRRMALEDDLFAGLEVHGASIRARARPAAETGRNRGEIGWPPMMDRAPLAGDWVAVARLRRAQRGFPVSGLDGVRRRRGVRAPARGRGRRALPRGGDMAEPGGAGQRGRQGRRGRAGEAQPDAPARGDRRELLAALLREERHDRLLRPARVGPDRRRRPAAGGAVGRPDPRARRASRGVGGAGARRGHRPRAEDRDRSARGGRPARAARGPPRRRAARARARPRSTALVAARDALARAAARSCSTRWARSTPSSSSSPDVEPMRNPGRAYGARTLAYVDCMRDLDVTIGPGLVAEIAPALQVLFEAGRWYCGRDPRGRPAGHRARRCRAGAGRSCRCSSRSCARSCMLPPAARPTSVAELRRRMAALLADPDPRDARRPGRGDVRRPPAGVAVRRLSVRRRADRGRRRGGGGRRRLPRGRSATCIPAPTRCCRASSPIAIPTRRGLLRPASPPRSARASRTCCRPTGPGMRRRRPRRRRAAGAMRSTSPRMPDVRAPGGAADVAAAGAARRRRRPRRRDRRAARPAASTSSACRSSSPACGHSSCLRPRRPRAARRDRPHGAAARELDRRRRPTCRSAPRTIAAFARAARHAAAGLHEVAAGAQADVPRHREPRARAHPLPPGAAGRGRLAGRADDASPRCCPTPERVLAARSRRRPLRLRAAARRRRRHARRPGVGGAALPGALGAAQPAARPADREGEHRREARGA